MLPLQLDGPSNTLHDWFSANLDHGAKGSNEKALLGLDVGLVGYIISICWTEWNPLIE